ncbi:MAG: hypothetical protein MI919_42220 [Holophagales bacterium]|nr:hypothetical protein [Holophagales bacterium]
MYKAFRLLAILLVVLATGCAERVEETDTGGVLLEVQFDNSQFRVGVNDGDLVSLDTVTISSIVPNDEQPSSQLQDVQLDTVELTYSRADSGTTVPPALVYNLVGIVPVGGELTYSNLPIMSIDQLNRPPLSDLLFENGAVDRETGLDHIRLNVTIRVFGRTVAGTEVASTPRSQTFEFVPTLTNIF